MDQFVTASATKPNTHVQIESGETPVKPRDLKKWHSQIAGLRWQCGSLDESSYRAALQAASLKLPQDVVVSEIKSRITSAGDGAKEHKIISQVNRAYDYVTGNRAGPMTLAPRPRFREAALRRVATKLPVDDVRAFLASRSTLHPDQVTSETFLKELYRPGEKVLVFTDYQSQGQALWPDCRSLPTCGPDGVWFLANPVSGKWHFNPRLHKNSRRSEESITSFRFAVLESDKADMTDWLKCLAQIPLAIAAIYESGGRSVHALVQVDAPTKPAWDDCIRKIKPVLVTLGADDQALTAVRLSRLPQATRGEKLQRLLYLNPCPDGDPISKQPAIHLNQLCPITTTK